ncbi:MAG: ABC transporter ATP-binding protein [Zestosphaera sp.]
MTLLKVRNLHASYTLGRSRIKVLNDVTFEVGESERVAVVGESGSGKSTLALIMARLNDDNLIVEGGEVRYRGLNILDLNEGELARLRGREIGVVLQNPSTSLNPLYPVGEQIAEALRAHGYSRGEAFEEAVRLLERVGIPEAERRYRSYPHQLSGGMKQRVAVAIAVALRPKLLIADEPTSALDVSIQAQILDLLKELSTEHRTALILITHDIGVAYDISEKVLVMYGGMVAEFGSSEGVLREPLHPYTKYLMNSLTNGLKEGLGRPANNARNGFKDAGACPFSVKCEHASEGVCGGEMPRQRLVGGRLVACNLY